MKSHQGSGGKNRPKAKRAVYDSLSRNFFNDRENAADFYNATHEGSPRISADDVEIVTLDRDRAIVDDFYNDCGFRVGDRLIIMLEVQTSHDLTLRGRYLAYLALTIFRYYRNLGKADDERLKELLSVELYIIYLGEGVGYGDSFTLLHTPAGNIEARVCREFPRKYKSGELLIFFKRVRERRVEGMTRQEMAEMILQVIDEFEEESVLKGYLMEHRGEIVEPMIEFLQNFDKPVYDAMLAGEQSRWNKERETLVAKKEEYARIAE